MYQAFIELQRCEEAYNCIYTHSKYSIQTVLGSLCDVQVIYYTKQTFTNIGIIPQVQIKTLCIMIFLFHSKMEMLFNFPIMNNKEILHIVQYQVCNVLHHYQHFIVCVSVCICVKNTFNKHYFTIRWKCSLRDTIRYVLNCVAHECVCVRNWEYKWIHIILLLDENSVYEAIPGINNSVVYVYM